MDGRAPNDDGADEFISINNNYSNDDDEEFDLSFEIIDGLSGFSDDGSDALRSSDEELSQDTDGDTNRNGIPFDSTLPLSHEIRRPESEAFQRGVNLLNCITGIRNPFNMNRIHVLSMHERKYLGDEMEELSGRTIHDDDDTVNLPLMVLPGVIVFPGQVVPLNLFHPQSINMVNRLVEADRTFGAIYIRKSHRYSEALGRSVIIHKVGTTIEIQSIKQDILHDVATLKVKAIGRQRFELVSVNRTLDGCLLGKVKILGEAEINEIPNLGLNKRNACLLNTARFKWNHLQTSKITHQKAASLLSPWPIWIYQMYNPHLLVSDLLSELHSWSAEMLFDHIPKDPVSFSHWVSSNLPFNDVQKLEFLQCNNVILRLRRQLEIIKKFLTFGCNNCNAILSEKKYLFNMCAVGPSSAYVNPGGFIYETITFSHASGLRHRGRASTAHSWFPGYAWTIIECRRCMIHVGWLFTAADKGLSPQKFWGLCRSSVVPLFEDGDFEADTKYMESLTLNGSGFI